MHTQEIIKPQILSTQFLSKGPYPWVNINGFFSDDFFQKLALTYPEPTFFEPHEGIQRGYGQRPHNRYYLAYEESVYKDFKIQRETSSGIIKKEELSNPWQEFISYLESADYRKFIEDLFQHKKFTIRFSWHMQVESWDVCPHVDSPKKMGSHLFYFNRSSDWDDSWGGATAILSGKKSNSLNPNFEEFENIQEIPFLDNRSFIFMNKPDAWHGVKPLKCPQGRARKIFAVVFNYPSQKSYFSIIKAPLKKLLSPLNFGK